MPWQDTDVVNARMRFVVALERDELSMTEACLRFGICRKTGYTLLSRFRRDGPEALRDRGCAPHSHPNQTPPETEGAILRVRKAHPTWFEEDPGHVAPRASGWRLACSKHDRCRAEARGRRGAAPHASPSAAAELAAGGRGECTK